MIDDFQIIDHPAVGETGGVPIGIPFSENCLRRDRSLSSCLIRSYSSFSLSFSTRNPVSPSFTISGVPPTEKAMAGFPIAMPSARTRPNVSKWEGRTVRSAAFSRCSTSVRCPRQRTLSDKCMARIFVFSRGSPFPFPMTRSFQFSLRPYLSSMERRCPWPLCSRFFMRDTMARTRVSLSKPNSFRSRICSSSFAVKRSVSMPL